MRASCSLAVSKQDARTTEINWNHYMFYRDFTIAKVKQKFNLTLVEGKRFLPEVKPVSPNPYLLRYCHH
ncbi:MAG: hypothetical protein AAF630_03750 [Cyanobacteria bacterium P01_C01_bin.38]